MRLCFKREDDGKLAFPKGKAYYGKPLKGNK